MFLVPLYIYHLHYSVRDNQTKAGVHLHESTDVSVWLINRIIELPVPFPAT